MYVLAKAQLKLKRMWRTGTWIIPFLSLTTACLTTAQTKGKTCKILGKLEKEQSATVARYGGVCHYEGP